MVEKGEKDGDHGSCPICKHGRKAREANSDFPFCSARCKSIDLGQWLSESYRVPTQEPPDGNGEGADSDE